MFIPLRRGFPHYCSSKKGNLKISSVVMRVTTRLVGSKTFSTFNKVVAEIPKSGIREVMAKADEIDRAGVFKHKVIRLEVGQPNFPSPAHVNDAACRAIMNGQTAYIPNAGMFSLREAVSNLYYTKHLKINTIPEQIIITTGSMLSVFSLLTAILEPNDECLLPIPGFPNYCQGIAVVGAVPVPYLCHPDDGYLPRLDDIEQLITPKTKCMIICNPGNPTGRNFPAAIVEKMMSIARKHNIFVISDEIYSEIVFDEKHTCSAQYDCDNMDDSKLAVVSGVSKAFSMTGYRVGWTRCSPQLIVNMTKLQEPMVSCGVPFAQAGALAALSGPRDCLEEMVLAYKARRDAALQVLAQRGRPSKYTPGGAFYLPVDTSCSGVSSLEFALTLLQSKGVAIAPGSAFDTGNTGAEEISTPSRASHKAVLTGFCRVSLANSVENVTQGISLICDHLDDLENAGLTNVVLER